MKKFIVGFLPHQQPGSPANTHRQGRGRQTLFWLIILGVVFLGWGCAVGSPMDQARRQAIKKMNDDARDRSAQEAEHFAFVHGQYVSSPKGKLLLIRRGPDLCAVRVTSYRRGHDASPRTFFYTGDETTYAEYDWVFQGYGSGDLTKSNVQTGRDELSRGGFVGLSFHFSGQLGNFKLECGEWELQWRFPTAVYFSPVDDPYTPADFEMAPTNWAQVSDIDLQDPRLHWYSERYGANMTKEDYIKKLIPAEDLPSGQSVPSAPTDQAHPKN